MKKKKRILRALVALSIIPGFGCRKVYTLLKELSDPLTAFTQSKRKLCSIPGIGEASALALLSFNRWDEADRILDATHEVGAQILTITDPLYPPMLKQIYDPPILLWLLGDPTALSSAGIAVVGTREPTPYGRECTRSLVSALTASGAAIYSGLAYGVDTQAHRTALDHGAITVAILGSGIDTIYPHQNRDLAKAIISRGGAVATEFAPGTPPDAVNFPVRNRIVSGLSLGVLVVESGMKGGSMITADLGLDQNREVFAVPHSLQNPRGEGGNYLIKKGAAKLVQTAEDILQELPGYFQSEAIKGMPDHSTRHWKTMELDDLSTRICELLEANSMQIDDLSQMVDLDTPALLVHLLQMELNGLVVQKAGKLFSLA